MLKDLQKENKYMHSELDRQQTTINNYAKVIEKKNRQIDLMAEQLAGLTIWNNEKEEPLILKDKEEVKQYFERKVKRWKLK